MGCGWGVWRRRQSGWVLSGMLLVRRLLGPAARAPADGRRGNATAIAGRPQGRVGALRDWSPTARLFDFRGSWESVNHQQADGSVVVPEVLHQYLPKGMEVLRPRK